MKKNIFVRKSDLRLYTAAEAIQEIEGISVTSSAEELEACGLARLIQTEVPECLCTQYVEELDPIVSDDGEYSRAFAIKELYTEDKTDADGKVITIATQRRDFALKVDAIAKAKKLADTLESARNIAESSKLKSVDVLGKAVVASDENLLILTVASSLGEKRAIVAVTSGYDEVDVSDALTKLYTFRQDALKTAKGLFVDSEA